MVKISEKTVLEIPDFITVRDLATLMELNPIGVIKKLMSNGIMASINQEIDYDTAAIVAEEMGFEPAPIISESVDEDDPVGLPTWKRILEAEKERDLQARPPVITMLGHVDHGKTSLLDTIRQTSVTTGEAGGITQHIGAYQAEKDGQLITFLDTPGHEAFTAMRARGAQATDIAILVIAADDGLMPQTREAIDHARAAKVPIIVALNKIDLNSARPDRVKQQLAEVGLVPDDWDGDTMVVPVSATQKIGIDDLLEAILLTAEELGPRANPTAEPTGTVLEAKTERGRGIMTTLLVQNGTLKMGDTLLIGSYYGRIKAMFDYRGRRVQTASPSTPVSVSALNGVPLAGDQFQVVANEREARRLVAEIEVAEQVQVNRPARLEDFFSRLQTGESKKLTLIIKADMQGSLEPILNSLPKLNNDEVEIEVLTYGTGDVSENDINLATASGAVVFGFNVNVGPAASIAANSAGIDVKTYTVIYHLLEDVERAIKGLMAPTYQEVVIGRAEVRQVFQIRKVGQIAGCFMRTGEARRNGRGRLIRGKDLLYDGSISSLKHIQESVRVIKAGFEFGVNLGDWNDYRENDIIEFYVTERVER